MLSCLAFPNASPIITVFNLMEVCWNLDERDKLITDIACSVQSVHVQCTCMYIGRAHIPIDNATVSQSQVHNGESVTHSNLNDLTYNP